MRLNFLAKAIMLIPEPFVRFIFLYFEMRLMPLIAFCNLNIPITACTIDVLNSVGPFLVICPVYPFSFEYLTNGVSPQYAANCL